MRVCELRRLPARIYSDSRKPGDGLLLLGAAPAATSRIATLVDDMDLKHLMSILRSHRYWLFACHSNPTR